MSIPSRIHPKRVTRSGPANDRFKARYRAIFWASTVVAAVVHVLILWLSPALGELPAWLATIDRLALVPPVDARPAPEPPPYIAPPEPGPLGGAGFEEIPRPAVPYIEEVGAPPADAVLGELGDGPGFTPYDVAPALENRTALVDTVRAVYPTGVPGVPHRVRTVLWFYIDEYGAVRKTLIRESSGYPELDRIIARAAAVAEFSPAWSIDRHVPAWISLPIVVQIASADAGPVDTAGVVPRP